MTLRLKTNGRFGGLRGSNICQPVAEANSFPDRNIVGKHFGAAETMQTSWGSYGRSERPAHTAFDPHLAAERLRHVPAGQHPSPFPPPRQPAGGGWGVSVCLKSAWKCGPVGLNQARASLLLLMYLVFVTSTRGQTSARGSQAGRSVQLSGTEVSQDRLRRSFSAGLSQIYDVFYNP